MAITTTADTNIGNLIAIYYDKLLLERLEPKCYFMQFGEKKPLPQHNGKTIYWTRYENFASAYYLDEGTIPGTSAMSAAKVSAGLVQLGQLIGISDLFSMTAISQPVQDAVNLLSDAGARTVDQNIIESIGFGSAASTGVTDLINNMPQVYTQGFPYFGNGIANILWEASAGATDEFSTAVCVDRVNDAITHLRLMNAPAFDDGRYVGIINPTQAKSLRQDVSWVNADLYAGSKKLYNGEIGEILGVRFIETTQSIKKPVLTSTWSGTYWDSGGTLYGTIIFGKHAYGVTEINGGIKTYIVPNEKPEKSDPLCQYGTVGIKYTGAAKILNPSCGIILVNYVSL